MAWTVRTTAPTNGTPPYDWNAGSIYECTWYAYWRVQEGFNMTDPPCWFSGSGSSGYGAYTDAKYWGDHYRSPWVFYAGQNYSPVAGDIIVFTGNFGHVVVVEEKNLNGTYVITDYNLIAGTHTFGRKTDYTFPNTISGAIYSTGAVIGVLHYPSSTPPTPPTPTTTPSITITPASYTRTMASSQNYLDFTFDIEVTGIPDGESASGGNTYPGLTREYNSGWTYTNYTVSGVTYRTATKRQTLRYTREYATSYTITKHMYFNYTFSNGSLSTDTPMYITVQAQQIRLPSYLISAISRSLGIRNKRKTLQVK